MVDFPKLIMPRRQALFTALGAAASLMLPAGAASQASVSASKLPRWRGFNLLEKFILEYDAPFREADFDFIAEFGFDYVRLPLDYRIWTDEKGGYREARLREIDQAIALGRARGIHVTLCLHRAPGFCVNPPKEALDLWGDGESGDAARKAFGAQWHMFAERYRAIPSTALSFNLINEPADISEDVYYRTVAVAVAAIRAADPDRLIIADGRGGGRNPTPKLASLGIAQSGRGYEPFHLTHYKADWVEGSASWPVPSWPLQESWGLVDQKTLWRDYIAPWQALEKLGVGIFVGEWGVFRHTPHDVALAWMKDCLENWKNAGWGWCLWNLRGDFGPLESRRADVSYEDYKGLKLDRRMLELLRRY